MPEDALGPVPRVPEDAPGPVPRVPEEAHSSDDLHMEEVLKKKQLKWKCLISASQAVLEHCAPPCASPSMCRFRHSFELGAPRISIQCINYFIVPSLTKRQKELQKFPILFFHSSDQGLRRRRSPKARTRKTTTNCFNHHEVKPTHGVCIDQMCKRSLAPNQGDIISLSSNVPPSSNFFMSGIGRSQAKQYFGK